MNESCIRNELVLNIYSQSMGKTKLWSVEAPLQHYFEKSRSAQQDTVCIKALVKRTRK